MLDKWGYPVHFTNEEKRTRAEKTMKALSKKGKTLSPVILEGRTIARTFWGSAWCDHIERFADFDNRLGRGRNYVRSGCVIDLGIMGNRIEATVQGSSLYRISITVMPLPEKRWEKLKKEAAGKVHALIDLIEGRLPAELIASLCNDANGLFPRASEMKFNCTCPDPALMCKHVAAVLYGVGNRLDSEPGLLFSMRGVDQSELVTPAGAFDVSPEHAGDILVSDDLEGLFGITLMQEEKTEPAKQDKAGSTAHGSDTPTDDIVFRTGGDVTAFREKTGMTPLAFANAIDISLATLKRWENSESLSFRAPTQKKIDVFLKKYKKKLQKKAAAAQAANEQEKKASQGAAMALQEKKQPEDPRICKLRKYLDKLLDTPLAEFSEDADDEYFTAAYKIKDCISAGLCNQLLPLAANFVTRACERLNETVAEGFPIGLCVENFVTALRHSSLDEKARMRWALDVLLHDEVGIASKAEDYLREEHPAALWKVMLDELWERRHDDDVSKWQVNHWIDFASKLS